MLGSGHSNNGSIGNVFPNDRSTKGSWFVHGEEHGVSAWCQSMLRHVAVESQSGFRYISNISVQRLCCIK